MLNFVLLAESPPPTAAKPTEAPDEPLAIEVALDIIDVPVEEQHSIVEEIVVLADYSKLLSKLKGRDGFSELVTHGTISTISGSEAVLNLTEKIEYPSIEWKDSGKDFKISTKISEFGTIMKVVPFLDYDSSYVDLRYEILHDENPPTIRTVDIRDGDGRAMKPTVIRRATKTFESDSVIKAGGSLLVACFTSSTGQPEDPLTFRMVFLSAKVLGQTPKAEQAGAGQPATRSESDPEGDDKPKPESEGRSR